MLTRDSNARNEKVRPTAEQRLAALETSITDVNEAIARLYKMLKEQGELITEYITKQVVASGPAGEPSGVSPEDALFTFVCRRKFDHVERELGRLRQLLAGSMRKVG